MRKGTVEEPVEGGATLEAHPFVLHGLKPKPGQQVDLVLLRQGHHMTRKATVGERPK